MKSFLSLIVFLIIIIGPFFSVMPIADAILFRTAYGLVVLSSAFLVTKKQLPMKNIITLLIFALIIGAIPFIVKRENLFLMQIIYSGLLGWLAYRYLRFSSAFLWFFWVLYGYFIYYWVVNGTLDDVFATVKNGIEAGTGRNYVGIVMLHLYLVYYTLCIHQNIKPNHRPIFIMPIIAILSAGVSSTISTLLLLGIYLINFFWSNKMKGLMVIIATVSLGYYFQDFFLSTELNYRLTHHNVGDDRGYIWTDFLDQIDIESFFVGFRSDVAFSPNAQGIVDSNYLANAHNSYLNLYYDVGIFSALYFVFIAYVAYKILLKNSMLFIVFMGTLFRAISDGYYFSTFIIDFELFYLFLITRPESRFVSAYSNRPRHIKIIPSHQGKGYL